jgi:hypothetical protein
MIFGTQHSWNFIALKIQYTTVIYNQLHSIETSVSIVALLRKRNNAAIVGTPNLVGIG